MKKLLLSAVTGLSLVAVGAATAATHAGDRFIVVASTTSTQNSGLFGYILPIFKKKTGIEVRVVAQGTGQALRTGRNGDADVVFVHARPAELKFVAAGWGVKRYPVMFNDFVIVGPKSDPAGLSGMKNAVKAFETIARKHAIFASRGDDSGTNKAEKRLWKAAGIVPKGSWYRETGSGMGATLNTAAQMNAYTLTDRGTWIAFKNKADMKIEVQGDKRLFNQYGVILVNPKKYPHVKVKAGNAFIKWLISPAGQKIIASYRVHGQQLFFPDAHRKGA